MEAGGPLEAGLGRGLVAGLVMLLAPLLVVANIPVPAIVGALVGLSALALMLRAPASTRHRWWMRALAADLVVLLALTAVTLLGHLSAPVATAWLTTYCGAIVLYGWTMEVLCRSVNNKRGAKQWGRTTATAFRASIVVLAMEIAAFATGDLRVVRGAYEFEHAGIGGIGFLASMLLLLLLVVRWGSATVQIKRQLQSHFETEPLRRMRATFAHD